jgi:hypothetical protein
LHFSSQHVSTAPAARTAASAARAAHTAAAVPSTVIHTATDTTIAVCTHKKSKALWKTRNLGCSSKVHLQKLACGLRRMTNRLTPIQRVSQMRRRPRQGRTLLGCRLPSSRCGRWLPSASVCKSAGSRLPAHSSPPSLPWTQKGPHTGAANYNPATVCSRLTVLIACHLARVHREVVPSAQPRAALLSFTLFSLRAPMLHHG